MRIGIITFWKSDDNYGQQMQMYALQYYLRSIGHDAYLIRYDPTQKMGFFSFLKRGVKKALKSSALLAIPSLRLKIKNEKKKQELKEWNKKVNVKREFLKFQNKNIIMSDKIYHSYSELRKEPPVADAYITGSDQVWHDSLFLNKTAGFFLQFGANNIKRIAYAASIGREIKENEYSILKKWLSTFTAISVREESACLECKHVGRFDAITTIDPTCLLSPKHYKSMMQKPKEPFTPYVFMYILNVDKTEDTGWLLVEEYIREKGWKVKTVASSGYEPACELIPNNWNILATIPQWLGLIECSEGVVTTSFHGMIFSILFHRPFLVVLLSSRHARANTRITHILSLLDLSNRIMKKNESMAHQMDSPIKWELVDKRIGELREKGCDFLKQALTDNL